MMSSWSNKIDKLQKNSTYMLGLWHNFYLTMLGEAVFMRTASSFFWTSSSFIHCLAALDLGAGVEQPFDCLIVQNRQAMQSMGRSTWSTVCSSAPPQWRPYPICTNRSGNVRHRCGGSWAGPRLFLGGSFRGCVYRCLELKCGVLWGCPPTPRSIDDPPTAPHVCCCQKNWWVVVWRVQMGVSIWGAVHLHSMDGWALSGADVQAPRHGVLETVWLHCDEAQQVGCREQLWRGIALQML